MTLEEKIMAFGAAQRNEKKMAENNRQAKLNCLLEKIGTYQDRIDYLINLGKMCKANGVKINEYDWRDKSKNKESVFISDAIYHCLGFNREFTAIGFYNGGWCGTVDTFVYASTENRPIKYNHNHEFDIKHLEKWINSFDEFEERFKNYIESL